MKVLTYAPYEGEFKGKDGQTVKYSKVVMMVSDRGQYPKLISVDVPVFQQTGGKIAGKEVEILYKESYGKIKAARIDVLD